MRNEETILEATLNSIKEKSGWERTDEIKYLIKVLDEKPNILKRAIQKYTFLESRNVWTDKPMYKEDDPEFLEYSEWNAWNGRGWEYIWKRLLIEVMIECDEHPEIIEHVRITDTKEKYGSLRIYWSCETYKMGELTSAAELLSRRTCMFCGKQPKDSKGRPLIWETQGWVMNLCKDCLKDDFMRDSKRTKKLKEEFREYARDCKNNGPLITTTYKSGVETQYVWEMKDGWIVKGKGEKIEKGR